MKTKLIALAIAVVTLTGCASTPAVYVPVKSVQQMTDAELCEAAGRAQAQGNTEYFVNIVNEGNSRQTPHGQAVDQATCQQLASMGAANVQREAQQQAKESARQQAAWAQVGAYGQQLQQQAQADQYRQQQQMNQQLQQMQQQQNTSALQGINRELNRLNNGW